MKNVNREEMVRAAVQGRGGEGGCAGWGGSRACRCGGEALESIPGSRNRPDEPGDVFHLLCNLKLT